MGDGTFNHQAFFFSTTEAKSAISCVQVRTSGASYQENLMSESLGTGTAPETPAIIRLN